MLASLALIFLAGLSMAAVFQRMKLPRIIGMLLSGVVLGPYALNLLDPSILSVSADLRQMALIIILLKAGLSLNLSDLKAVGRPAVLLSFVPACFEILAVVLFAPLLLGVAGPEAAAMGAVLGAVSPAVVIPRMVRLIETGYGMHKSIPQMIMAAASCDDVFVIVLFSTFVSMAQGGVMRLTDVCRCPFRSCSALRWGPPSAMRSIGCLRLRIPISARSETAQRPSSYWALPFCSSRQKHGRAVRRRFRGCLPS